jgi:5'-3' exonuclease, N-terminal resolvase-like domain/T4 RNase H, C terminal
VIVVDFSQVMLSNLMMQLGSHTNASIEEGMFRHMVLNSLRSYRQKFGKEFGELVIACDNTNYWRKKLFPYYKANRKKNLENSELDWKSIFESMNKVKSELKEYFPYKVLDIESAEADDIIATLCKEYTEKENILILSGDKDFVQLHKYKVKQYDPVRKKWITHNNPNQFLKEHILSGDRGDGVPNVLSSDNCFVVGDRQKPLTSKKLKQFLENDINTFDTNIIRNYQRNEKLIDLSFVPDEIVNNIMVQFNNQNKNRSKLREYFINNKLKNLMESIGEF